MSIPWFFLSYARVDSTGNAHLAEFYTDLVREVRRIAGLGNAEEAEIGFFDVSGIKTGASWPEILSGSLQTCRVFICLYSRGYFNSEFCGKEIQVFQSRVNDYVQGLSTKIARPPLIIPVLWDRPDRLHNPLPRAVSEIQYKDSDLGEIYANEGLYFIMKVSKFKSEYDEFLLRFAGRIFEAANANILPPLPNLPLLNQVKSAFHEPKAEGPKAVALGESACSRVAQFVYVAGKNTEVSGVRHHVDCYGDQGGREWQPYYPEVAKSVGIISQGIATMEDLQYETYPVGDNLIEKIRAAEETNSIVVIVVDPWSIQVESYQKHMLDFDKTDFLNCGILIPWNEKDEETSQSLDKLQANVQKTFTRKFILNTYFQDSIHSMDELEKEICATINEVRRRLLLKAKVQRPVESTGTPIPSITGLGGATE
ncbi:MAG TPA: TIR-like protein FxsC [Pyrinomonadaceae bacterium]|jgi:FxsC-like protein